MTLLATSTRDAPLCGPAAELTPPLGVLALAYHFAPAGGSAVIRNTKILSHLPAHGVRLDVITVEPEYLGDQQNMDLRRRARREMNVVTTRCLYPQRWLVDLKRKLVGRAAPGVSDSRTARPTATGKASRKKGPWQSLKDVLTYSLGVPIETIPAASEWRT